MGLESNNNSGKKYVTVVAGNLTIRVSAGTQGAVQRQLTAGDNKGKVVNELQFPRLRGMITKLAYVQKENFGEFVEITVTDDQDYLLQLPWNSGMKTSILTRLPNVDLSKEVCFNAFADTEKENRNVLLIYQGKTDDGKDKLVPVAYSKDNPNGMPQAKKTMKLGKPSWDFSEVEEFLYGVLQAAITKVQELNPPKAE